MLIDCETCIAPAAACRDCVVTFLLERPAELPAEPPNEPPNGPPAERPFAGPAARVDLDATETAAIDSLIEAGLVPPLRLVSATVPLVASGSSPINRDIA